MVFGNNKFKLSIGGIIKRIYSLHLCLYLLFNTIVKFIPKKTSNNEGLYIPFDGNNRTQFN